MQLKKIGWLFLLFAFLVNCDDIIEEEDISNQSITVLAPLDGAIVNGNSVSFNWNQLEDTRSYKVQLAQPNFENAVQILIDSLVVQDTLGNVSTKIQATLLNGNYQWRVKGLNGGFETPFTVNGFTVNGDENVDLVAPNTPTPLTPTDGTSQTETAITFTWSRENVPGTVESDSIYVYSDVDLQNLELKAIGVDKAFETTLSANTYYWLVQAFDVAGNKSEDSVVFELIIN